MFDSLGAIFKGKIGFQRLQNVGKTAEENQNFLNPGRTKSIQYIGLRFLDTVNHAMLLQN